MSTRPLLTQSKPHAETAFRSAGVKIVVGIVGVALLSLLVGALVFKPVPAPLPVGEWSAKDGSFWMQVGPSSIRIGRTGEKATFAVLPNNANGQKIYDRDDMTKAHPYHLRTRTDGSVEWLREATGPSPEYTTLFLKGGGPGAESGSVWRPPWEP